MNISYRWLSRHVDLTGISPEALAENLTLSTAEVEGVEPFAPHMNDVVVGHVLERVPHPDADKLGVCQVDVGDGEILNIVCGAPNVAKGQNVAVAKIGTRLPGDFKIKKSKIRGVPSVGMICSESELELGDGHDGIWVLPESCVPGTPVAEALGMQDWIIEIDNKSLTHRPDLWGHRGLAGEVAAIFERELKPLDLSLPELGAGKAFPVRVDDASCSRYLGLAIDGVKQEPSPEWLRFLLLAVGQRPLDLLVDLSNFVMLDLGQPNHTFDRSGLSEQGIIVRSAKDGETMTTLDELERKLTPADLLITDGDRPVALAGIMGGLDSKVEGVTSQLLLEVANFAPAVIRRTSSRLGLRSDASARFEKSLDPLLPVAAAGHFARLLQGLQPDVSFPLQLSDAGDWSDPSCTIEVRGDRIRSRLGVDLDDAGIVSILKRLHLNPTLSAGVITVHVPACRATKDLGIEEDIVEEVGRIYRYGNVPTRPLVGVIEPVAADPRRTLVRRLQDRLAGGARFHESMGYSFVPDALLGALGILGEPRVSVINPVAEGVSKMRRSLTPSLIDAALKNRARFGEVALFEVGKGYLPVSADATTEPTEVHLLGAVLALAPDDARTFRESALARLHATAVELLTSLGIELSGPVACDAVPAWAHPKKCLAIKSASTEGTLGFVTQLDPGVSVQVGFAGDMVSEVAILHISIDTLLGEALTGFAYRPLPKFPEVKVDVAIQAPDSMAAAELIEQIEKAGKGIVAHVEAFDLFRGDSLPENTRSLAFHVRLYAASRTLTDKDSQKFLQRLTRSLAESGAELRGA
ncbi:MAG: phenylalanyl-tRNA synthetase beta chain [Glaciecola sp.]|jgi:phenylalanyl-tRNA synthetase beta chain